jgi:hypothetical protein
VKQSWRRRVLAYRVNRLLGRGPGPLGADAPPGCYCARMPPNQLCHWCITDHIKLATPPCRRRRFPLRHRWERYVMGDGRPARTCGRCRAWEAL